MFTKPWLGLGTPGVILGFHSIVTQEWPSRAPMHVPPAVLTSLVTVASRLGTVVPIEDLVRRHEDGKSTRGLVALTFDDAYASLLESEFARQEIPFAVAAVSGYLGDQALFWWDRIEDLYEVASPDARIRFAGAIGLAGGDTGFEQVRRQILVRYKGRVTPECEAAISQFERVVGMRTAQRPQRLAELRQFAARPWITVLPHTVSHPVLPLLRDEDIVTEVANSTAALRDAGLRVAPILAAPYGLYDERTVRAARSAGMTAVLTLAGRTLRTRRAGQVPRFCIMRSEKGWKLGLRMAGIVERVQALRGVREQGPLEELGVGEEHGS